LTSISCGPFDDIQKWMPHRTARWVRRISKRWQRNSELIERRACEYATSHGYRHVTCGHTHLPMTAVVDGVHYLNSGTWTEAPPCPFVSIRGADVQLEFWPFAQVEIIEPQAVEVSLPSSPVPTLR
jgi:UDP-2,3-diacylglucosamine pyrophosphatase LpxH